MRRHAYTLVEMMVALAIFSVILVALALTWLKPSWAVFDPFQGRGPDTAPIEQQVRRLTQELQEATRVFHPLPGEGPRDGLGIVDIRGRALVYYVEPAAAGGRPVLRRRDMASWQTGEPDDDEPFLSELSGFRASVAPVEPGKEASLVELDIGVLVRSRNGRDERLVNFVTSAFLRNLERHVPDDIVPAGSPPLISR